MIFYVSWTDSDPQYQQYDGSCNLLISPPVLPRDWKVTRLAALPRRLFLDSGAFTLARSGRNATQQDLFRWQLDVVSGVDPSITTISLSHLDQPMPPGLPAAEGYRLIERTLANAYEFLELAHRHRLEGAIDLVGVIQGYDAESIAWCAHEMGRLGFRRFGLGSLAMLFDHTAIMERVTAAVQEVGTNLHVFGVSGIATMKALHQKGIASFDTCRPMKAAINYTLFYSDPWRRFGIAGTRRALQGAAPLAAPLHCRCPVCRFDPWRMFLEGRKMFSNLRALHNYWHLKREICGAGAWRDGKGGAPAGCISSLGTPVPIHDPGLASNSP